MDVLKTLIYRASQAMEFGYWSACGFFCVSLKLNSLSTIVDAKIN